MSTTSTASEEITILADFKVIVELEETPEYREELKAEIHSHVDALRPEIEAMINEAIYEAGRAVEARNLTPEENLRRYLAQTSPGSAEALMQEEQPRRDRYVSKVEEYFQRIAPAFEAALAAIAAQELKEASK